MVTNKSRKMFFINISVLGRSGAKSHLTAWLHDMESIPE